MYLQQYKIAKNKSPLGRGARRAGWVRDVAQENPPLPLPGGDFVGQVMERSG
jgi:hypothetical protein